MLGAMALRGCRDTGQNVSRNLGFVYETPPAAVRDDPSAVVVTLK